MSFKASQTRRIFLEAAQQLFARHGVNHVSLRDVSLAAGKGQRTLFRYFKNKEELYAEVVQMELSRLSAAMRDVAECSTTPDSKLLDLIHARLNLVRDTVRRNGTLKAKFFRDIWRVESVRRQFDETEIQIFVSVLTEGVEKGFFEIDDVHMAAELIHYCLKGIEVPYIRGHIGQWLDEDTRRDYVRNIVMGAVRLRSMDLEI